MVPLLGRMIGKCRGFWSSDTSPGGPRVPRLAPDWIGSHDVGDPRVDHGQEARAWQRQSLLWSLTTKGPLRKPKPVKAGLLDSHDPDRRTEPLGGFTLQASQ